jgi:succinylglutamate desuccinylase
MSEIVAPSIEIEPPNLTRWAGGNTGIPYVWTFDSGAPGPHVAIAALTHGNEYCGAIALDELLRASVRPARGRLSFAFNNVEAFARFDPHEPFKSRCVDEDFNRLWDTPTLEGLRASHDLTRARQLRAFYDTVDHLLDLHSMHEASPALLLCGLSQKGIAQARSIGYPANVLIDGGHSAGRRLFDYAAFADDASAKTAYLVECGQHWEANALQVAKESCATFLTHFGVAHPFNVPTAQPQTFISVVETITVHDEAAFKWAQPWESFACVPARDTLLATEGSREIRTPRDDCYLVMPAREPKSGHTAVRLGVRVGG